jgi:hypothetical protein
MAAAAVLELALQYYRDQFALRSGCNLVLAKPGKISITVIDNQDNHSYILDLDDSIALFNSAVKAAAKTGLDMSKYEDHNPLTLVMSENQRRAARKSRVVEAVEEAEGEGEAEGVAGEAIEN